MSLTEAIELRNGRGGACCNVFELRDRQPPTMKICCSRSGGHLGSSRLLNF
jgi:hypothetical protein